ncbi:MAG: 4'-phosphopantetheinyl transferase superfamily protein [Verrucomicrobia bacterium]|nr:4'-phosphopantetheinyl transferase superfamily protein [Verrucomicrobiota bacterium]
MEPPLQITSDGANRYEGGIYYAEDNVTVTYGGDVLMADQVHFNPTTKEATAKAFGTGIGATLPWLGMEIGRQSTGQPFLRFHQAGEDLARIRGVTRTLVTLTHTRNHSAATVALLGS